MPLGSTSATFSARQYRDISLCRLDDLVPDSGVCALGQDHQIALFWLSRPEPSQPEPAIYAIGNYDPLGGANVLSRGIVGDLDGEPVVASPLYKHHYSLRDGQCREDNAVFVPVYAVRVVEGVIYASVPC